jgi:hypothetical protein
MYDNVEIYDSFEDIEEVVTPGNGTSNCCNSR